MYYSLTRATAWNLAGYLYLILVSLISLPVLVRSLGLELFAQYSLIIATLTLLSAFNLGLPQAVVRALSQEHGNFQARSSIWATSSLLFILTGVIAGVTASIASYYLRIRLDMLVLVFALGFLANVVAYYSTLPQAEGHFGYFNAKTFIVGTSNTLLAAYLASAGQGIAIILFTQLLSYFITLLPLVYFSHKFFPHPRVSKFSLSVAKSLLSFGLKNQVGTLFGQIQSQYAKYLLISLSPLNLSAYVIAQGLVQKLIGSVTQIATALYPTVSNANLSTVMTKTYWRIQLYLFLIGSLTVILYGYFGLPFLTWWLGDLALVQSVHTFLLAYRFYGLLLLLTPLASTILDGRGYPGMTTLLGGLTLTIELFSAVILYPKLGLFAPAYAGIISLMIMVPILLLFTQKTLSRDGTAIR